MCVGGRAAEGKGACKDVMHMKTIHKFLYFFLKGMSEDTLLHNRCEWLTISVHAIWLQMHGRHGGKKVNPENLGGKFKL